MSELLAKTLMWASLIACFLLVVCVLAGLYMVLFGILFVAFDWALPGLILHASGLEPFTAGAVTGFALFLLRGAVRP